MVPVAGSSTSDEVVWLYRCRFCGLLNTSVKAVFDHMRQLHNEPKHSWTTSRSQWEAMCAPEKVLRRRQPCKTFLPSAMHPGPEPFAGLSLQQPGARPLPLERLVVHLRFLGGLMQHVYRPDGAATDVPVFRKPGIAVKDWFSFSLVSGSSLPDWYNPGFNDFAIVSDGVSLPVGSDLCPCGSV